MIVEPNLSVVGFRNRTSVLLNWAWSYATHERGPRLTFDADDPDGTGQPRQALDDQGVGSAPDMALNASRRAARDVIPSFGKIR